MLIVPIQSIFDGFYHRDALDRGRSSPSAINVSCDHKEPTVRSLRTDRSDLMSSRISDILTPEGVKKLPDLAVGVLTRHAPFFPCRNLSPLP